MYLRDSLIFPTAAQDVQVLKQPEVLMGHENIVRSTSKCNLIILYEQGMILLEEKTM